MSGENEKIESISNKGNITIKEESSQNKSVIESVTFRPSTEKTIGSELTQPKNYEFHEIVTTQSSIERTTTRKTTTTKTNKVMKISTPHPAVKKSTINDNTTLPKDNKIHKFVTPRPAVQKITPHKTMKFGDKKGDPSSWLFDNSVPKFPLKPEVRISFVIILLYCNAVDSF